MRHRTVKLLTEGRTSLYACLQDGAGAEAAGEKPGPAVIILADGTKPEERREAEHTALFFQKKGCRAFLLFPEEERGHREEILAAVQAVREKASVFGNDPQAVVLVGLRSGAAAAMDAALHGMDGGERARRPDAAVLLCGKEKLLQNAGAAGVQLLSGKSAGEDLAENLEGAVPPLFFWHVTQGWQSSAAALISLIRALQRQGAGRFLRGPCPAPGKHRTGGTRMGETLLSLANAPAHPVPAVRAGRNKGEENAKKAAVLPGEKKGGKSIGR